jgi:hypothetical protein
MTLTLNGDRHAQPRGTERFYGGQLKMELTQKSLVAFIPLSGLGFRLGVLFHVLRERAADIVALLELPLIVTPYVTLVRAGVDELPATWFLFRHWIVPLQGVKNIVAFRLQQQSSCQRQAGSGTRARTLAPSPSITPWPARLVAESAGPHSNAQDSHQLGENGQPQLDARGQASLCPNAP